MFLFDFVTSIIFVKRIVEKQEKKRKIKKELYVLCFWCVSDTSVKCVSDSVVWSANHENQNRNF